MTSRQTACRGCAAIASHTDRFCESCGALLSEVRRVCVPRAGRSVAGRCADCGNEAFADGYCTGCGIRRAEPDREHADLAGIALVTDRGRHHARNEDAAAAGIVAHDPSAATCAIAVAVCDGVSTSGDAHTAAVAASTAGVGGMLAALNRDPRTAVLAGLAEASKAAAAARIDQPTPPCCTYTAATVVPNSDGTMQITIGNVGDSRAYWLPEPPEPARLLTVDDSLAQELVSAGAPAGSDAVRHGAHTLTRWLGADAESTPWTQTNVDTITTAGPGFLLLCTDGLWNYLHDPADIADICTGVDAAAAARALVDYALDAGGQDNITVAVIKIGGRHEFN